mmetsp:Transcript_1280/g.3753  ORF Transcript_1280/g.3753 Transcript_1280/m.3753 type:complete len:326 (-) Transcript_1280:673-1650(-)
MADQGVDLLDLGLDVPGDGHARGIPHVQDVVAGQGRHPDLAGRGDWPLAERVAAQRLECQSHSRGELDADVGGPIHAGREAAAGAHRHALDLDGRGEAPVVLDLDNDAFRLARPVPRCFRPLLAGREGRAQDQELEKERLKLAEVLGAADNREVCRLFKAEAGRPRSSHVEDGEGGKPYDDTAVRVGGDEHGRGPACERTERRGALGARDDSSSLAVEDASGHDERGVHAVLAGARDELGRGEDVGGVLEGAAVVKRREREPELEAGGWNTRESTQVTRAALYLLQERHWGRDAYTPAARTAGGLLVFRERLGPRFPGGDRVGGG